MDFNSLNQLAEDYLSPNIVPRWIFTGFLVFVYIYRVAKIRTHAVITYCIGVYLLHSFILFVTPKDDSIPDPFENVEDDDYNPRNIDNDFRPYVRKLPEFQFWKFCVQAISISYFLTFFPFTNLPVFPRILVIYFVFIVLMTAYKLALHSKKYKYSIFSTGKASLTQ